MKSLLKELSRHPIDFKCLGKITDKLLIVLCFITLSADLFLVCSRAAEIERGGVGEIGGEYFILLIPIVAYYIKQAIKDVLRGATK